MNSCPSHQMVLRIPAAAGPFLKEKWTWGVPFEFWSCQFAFFLVEEGFEDVALAFWLCSGNDKETTPPNHRAFCVKLSQRFLRSGFYPSQAFCFVLVGKRISWLLPSTLPNLCGPLAACMGKLGILNPPKPFPGLLAEGKWEPPQPSQTLCMGS